MAKIAPGKISQDTIDVCNKYIELEFDKKKYKEKIKPIEEAQKSIKKRVKTQMGVMRLNKIPCDAGKVSYSVSERKSIDYKKFLADRWIVMTPAEEKEYTTINKVEIMRCTIDPLYFSGK